MHTHTHTHAPLFADSFLILSVALDMSIDLGGAVRQDTSQNLLENVSSDTELFNENRLSSYNVKFKEDSSDGYRPLSQTLSPNWSTLEDLKEEEKVGCDDLLLAQQLRAESPHLRLESEHRRASADVGVTPSPPPSPQRSSAMCKAQRVSLGNVRRNVLSRTPSPQGYGTNDTPSPPMRRRAGSKENDSPFTRRRGSSKDSGQLIVRGELKIPANSFDSDSSVEVNRELLRVHQMGSTTDEDMPLIMISSDIEAQLYYGDEQNDERRFSSPKLKRKNASRRRRGSAKAKVEVEQDEEVETKGETNMYNQDGESDLSFQPLESDLNFQPMQTDLNFDSKLSSTKPVHSDTTEDVRDEKETPLIDTAPVKPPDNKEEPEEETAPVQTQEEQTNINGINEERTSETPAQEEEEEKEEEGSTGLLNEDLSDLSFSFRKSDDEDEPKHEKLKKPSPAPPAGTDKVSKPVTPLIPQPMSPSTHSASPSVSPSIPSVSPLVSSPPPTATSSPPHSATPPPQSGPQSPKTPPPHSAIKPTQSAPVSDPPTQSAPVNNPPTQSAPVSSPPTQSAPVSDPPTQSVTTPPTQPPKTESPKPAPRRRTLIVKSSPSNSEIKTPPPSSSPQEPVVATTPPSPVQSKGVKDDGETGGKQFEEKSGFSLRRKNATRSGGSKSPRHNSKEVSPLATSQEMEGMNTLERKRAKAKEAARRLRESGQASQYRSEKQDTSVSSVESDGMSTLERKRAKAREAARRLKQGGESSQSRIERDAQGEIIQERRIYDVEYRPESPASLI